MKTKIHFAARASQLALAVAVLSTLNSQLSTLFAQGTAFTYQGRLSAGTGVANGNYDMQFYLRDALAPPGNPVGPTNTITPVPVSNGLFTVALDFGANFPGADRWLEIGVRTNGAASYTTLSPRQPLTPAPYAITAGNLSGTLPSAQLSGTYSGAVTLNNAADSFTGNGAGLTSLNASQLTTGTVPDARLAANIARINQVWLLNGNAGTTAGANLLGTTDNQALELKVKGNRALRLEPTVDDATHSNVVNVVGGALVNLATPGVRGATISGGGGGSGVVGINLSNVVSGDFGSIGGGTGNRSSGQYGTVGGGYANTSSNYSATVAGGYRNTSGGLYGTVGGGAYNKSSGEGSTVGGGEYNSTGNNYATVGGGTYNSSSGQYATVGGGQGNQAIAYNSTVGGGQGNQASAYGATVAGGYGNTSSGSGAFVGGGGFDGGTYSANVAGGGASAVGGGLGNSASSLYATTAGGVYNSGSGEAAFIGGGIANTNSGFAATVSGGENNFTSSDYSSVGGGRFNTVRHGSYTTIAGGFENVTGDAGLSIGDYASVGGGYGNNAEGNYSTVPGGLLNWAPGSYSFAAGRQAKAVNNGSFVWADSTGADFASTADDQFCVRAHGGVQFEPLTSLFFGSQTRQMLNLWGSAYGVGIQSATEYFRTDGGFAWYKGGVHNDNQYNSGGGATLMTLSAAGLNVNGTFVSASDRNIKENFGPVDPRVVLAKVAALPLTQWNYKADPATRHLGPMAQDFYAAFAVGPDDKHISMVDADGVALAAIQGLNQKVEEQRAENVALRQELIELKNLMNLLNQKLSKGAK